VPASISTTSIIVAAVVVLLLVVISRGRGSSHGIDVDTATEEDIPALLMGGHKIDAIKVYRRLHGVDLKGAKEAVERLAAGLPRHHTVDGRLD
jgi:large subunit ribosomal protein L7/L12